MFETRKMKNNLKYPFEIMKWEPKNIDDSILPISALNWVAGLSIFEHPFGKPRPIFTFIYAFLIHFTYWFVTYNTSRNLDASANNIVNSMLTLVKCVKIFVGTVSVLIGWYYYKTFKTNIRKLELVDEALEYSGLPKNYRTFFINSFLKVVMWVVTSCILFFNDLRFIIQVFDLVKCLKLIYLFYFPLYLTSVLDLTFTSIINCIRIRFENINLLLKRSLLKFPELKSDRKLYVTEFNTRLNDSQQKIKLLVLVRHLHMQLSKISLEINTIYQKQLIMKMVAHFAIITGLLYILFSVILFNNETSDNKANPTINASLWSAVFVYKSLKINLACAGVSKESRKTSGILYELKNSNEDEELKEEIDQFSLQLAQRPLYFTPCGIITLDYTFIQRFIASITTYLVILIQMSPEVRK